MEENGVYSGSILRILVDEAPECYKDSDIIIERIQPSIEIKEHLKPFINIKNEFIDKSNIKIYNKLKITKLKNLI